MSDADLLKSRIKAAARAQNVFLWTLLALGLFYWSLGSPILALLHSAKDVSLPFIGLRLPTAAVWATAPAVLFFVLLAVYGTLRVCDDAIAELKRLAPDEKEPDLQANVLDYVIHTTAPSPAAVKKLLGFAYPAYLTVFVVEASWLTYTLATVEAPVPGRWVLLALAVLQGVLVVAFTALFWLRRFKRPGKTDRAT